MTQTVAAISNVNKLSVDRSTFNMTFSPDKDPNEKLREIANWLTSINFGTIQIDTLSKRTPQTGLWFIESPEYQAWLSKDSGVLWVNGSPGAGKTILSSIVIHHLQERVSSDQETAIVFAYCRYTDRCSVTDILASFVKQLAQCHPSVVLPIIEPVYNDRQRKEIRLSERELQELLQELLKLFKKTYITIDALDEFPDDTRANLLMALSLLRASRASLLITSRPLHLLGPYLPDAAYVCIEAENQKDIELFIDKQIEETPRLRALLEGKQDSRKTICTKLKEKSQGMFLLTALQIDGLKRCISVKTLRQAVDSLPSGLNALYECTWSRIQSQTKDEVSLAMKAIIWLTYARRSLVITELQHALAVSDEMEGFDEDDVAAKELIVSVCCGLVVVDERSGVVRLVHYTTYDFFMEFSSNLCSTPHTLITTSCLTYLSAFDFMHQELGMLEHFLSSHPLLRYAYDHWGSHAKACYGEAGLPAGVITFLAQAEVYPYVGSHRDLLGPGHIGAVYGLLDVLPAMGEWCNQVTQIMWYTPLILASANGQEEIVKVLLLEHDVDINSQGAGGQTALLAASQNGHGGIVQLLLSRNDIDINTRANHGETALFAASQNGHEGIVQLLLSRNDVDINSHAKYDGTALFAASKNGHEGIVNLLLSRNDVDINTRANHGETALFAASKNGHEGIVQLLLSRNHVNINSQTDWHATALFAACQNGYEGIVQLLLSRNDVDINSQTDKGQTALYAASKNGQEAIVQLLLSRNDVNINSQTDWHATALSAACQNEHEGIVQLLLSRNDVDINTRTCDGKTALFVASKDGHEGIVQLLLSRNDVDINSRTSDGQTALFVASKNGHEGIVQLLLSRNVVDINSRANHGKTALFVASKNGHEGIVQLLLSRNHVNINSQTDWHATALFAACQNGYEGIVQLLLSRNDVDINSQTDKGQTALFAACRKGYEGIVQSLLSRKDIDIHAQTEWGATALSAACQNGHEGIVSLFSRNSGTTQSLRLPQVSHCHDEPRNPHIAPEVPTSKPTSFVSTAPITDTPSTWVPRCRSISPKLPEPIMADQPPLDPPRSTPSLRGRKRKAEEALPALPPQRLKIEQPKLPSQSSIEHELLSPEPIVPSRKLVNDA